MRWNFLSFVLSGKVWKTEQDIILLKCGCLAFLDFLYLLTYSPFFAHCHPPWIRLVCLPTPASSKHCQRFTVREDREWEAVGEGERSRSRDAMWVTPLNEARCTVHGAPSAEHTSKPVLHLYCQHLGEERIGARVEQPLSSAGSLPTASLVNVPFKLPTRATKLLMCLPHYHTFYFHPIPISFILLTSHFLLASSAFSSVFDFN